MPRPIPEKCPPDIAAKIRKLGFSGLKDFSHGNDIVYSTTRSVLLISSGTPVLTIIKLADALSTEDSKVSPEYICDIFCMSDADEREKIILELRTKAGLVSNREWARHAGVDESTIRNLHTSAKKLEFVRNARSVATALGLDLKELASKRWISIA